MNGGTRLGYEGHQFLLFLYVGIVTGPPKHYPDEAGTVTCNVRASVPAAWLVRAFKSRLVSNWANSPPLSHGAPVLAGRARRSM